MLISVMSGVVGFCNWAIYWIVTDSVCIKNFLSHSLNISLGFGFSIVSFYILGCLSTNCVPTTKEPN